MFNKEIFAERLQGLRAEKGITAVTLAKDLGVSKQAIFQLEKGENYPHCNTLVALAQYYEVSMDYLAGLTDEPNSGLAKEETK